MCGILPNPKDPLLNPSRDEPVVESHLIMFLVPCLWKVRPVTTPALNLDSPRVHLEPTVDRGSGKVDLVLTRTVMSGDWLPVGHQLTPRTVSSLHRVLGHDRGSTFGVVDSYGIFYST